jgi:hypothetical protein
MSSAGEGRLKPPRCRLMPQAEVYPAIFDTRTEAETDLPAVFATKIKARAEEQGIPL